MSTSGSTQRLLAALLAIPLILTFDLAPAQASRGGAPGLAAPPAEPEERSIVLADLGFRVNVRATFTLGELSGDFGLVEDGEVGGPGPAIPDRDSLLAAYLEGTPRQVPVPRELLAEWPAGTPYPDELAHRRIVPAPVRMDDLATTGHAVAATVTCWSAYYDPYHWYEPAGSPNPTSKTHQAKTFYSSQFGGMAMYSRSFVANCGTTARHRIYYKSFGDYYKQHDKSVPNGHWQAVKKGSVHRYRKVHYDFGQGYTRNGRYTG